jgi:RimJ/RimL family protein N-acetyltransferase
MNPDGFDEEVPALEGDGVRQVPLTQAHAPAMYRLFSDPEVVQYTSVTQFADPSDAQRWIQRGLDAFESGAMYRWAIELDREVVGTSMIFGIDREHRNAEIGFAVLREYWGQRIVTRVIPPLLSFAFERLRLHRVEADVEPHNTASLLALQRHGFRKEGVLRERSFKRGRFHDSTILSILRPEWGGPRP